MNYLFNDVNWSLVKNIGFDMDGTLYDEYQFIVQPYSQISGILNKGAFEFMCHKWLEKGSSYNKIFDEAFEKYGTKNKMTKTEFINKSLNIFRNFLPELSLSKRTESILEYCSTHYNIFLVSDGNPILQKNKFESLNLNKYFSNQKIIFTGNLLLGGEKPSIDSFNSLKILANETVFFGDRSIDEKYANNVGMQYQNVYNMISIKK